MNWFIYILISAIFFTVSIIFKKKSLKNYHAMEFLSIYKIFQLLFILIFLIWFVDFKLPINFIGIFYLIAFVHSIGLIYITKSYRHKGVSVVSPFLNLSSFFVLILAYFILGERISVQQILGVAVLLIGSYLLQSTENLKKYIKTYWKHNYLFYTIFAVLLLAIASIGDKYSLNFVAPITALCFIWAFTVMNILLFHFAFYNGLKDIKKSFKKPWKTVLISAFAMMISNVTYYLAISQALISLVMPIKRLSTLFDTLIGGELFHEKKLIQKFLACIIMIIGTILIVI